MKQFAIAIDGPAGSGKSTIAKGLASALGIVYIDTGAMYRAVGLYAARQGVATTDEAKVVALLPEIEIALGQQDGVQHIFLNGEDVSRAIRTAEAGQGASDVAVFLPVREKLVAMQRELAEKISVVMDGRDIGTCVLPDAEVKIYLSADPMERAKRRLAEFAAKGESADLQEVYQQILARDKNDMTREHNPLRKAEDAVEIDSTHLDIAQVTAEILSVVQKKLGGVIR